MVDPQLIKETLGAKVGIYPRYESSPSQGTTHIRIGEELVNPEDMETWGEVT